MVEGFVKNFYQTYFVIPLAKKLTRIHSNHITISALIVGCVSSFVIINGHHYWGVALLFLSGYLDSLDGVHARLMNSSSAMGSVLDIICDRVVEFLIITSLYLIDPLHRGLYSLLILGSSYICVTSFLISGIFIKNDSNKSFHYSNGLMERFEAFIFFAAMIIFPKYFDTLAIIYTILVAWTALFRLKELFSYLDIKDSVVVFILLKFIGGLCE